MVHIVSGYEAELSHDDAIFVWNDREKFDVNIYVIGNIELNGHYVNCLQKFFFAIYYQ